MIINQKILSTIAIFWTLLAISNLNVLAVPSEEDVSPTADLPSNETISLLSSTSDNTELKIKPRHKSSSNDSSDSSIRDKRFFFKKLFKGKHDFHVQANSQANVQTNFQSNYQSVNYDSTNDCLKNHYYCKLDYPSEMQSEMTRYGQIAPCICDDDLFQCLLRSPERKAINVGQRYFDEMSHQCLIYDHPAYECLEIVSNGHSRRCALYKTDLNGPTIYQLRDNPFFTTN